MMPAVFGDVLVLPAIVGLRLYNFSGECLGSESTKRQAEFSFLNVMLFGDWRFLGLRGAGLRLFIVGVASLCFHFFVLYQFSAWPPSAELSSPAVIKAKVLTRAGASVVPNPSPTPRPIAFLSPSSSLKPIERVGAQVAKKVEAAQDEMLTQTATVGVQFNTADSLNVVSQAQGGLSEIAPLTTDGVPPLPIFAVIEFSRHGFLGRTIRSTHLWRSVGDHYSLSVEGGSNGGLTWFEATSSPFKSEGQLLGNELRPESFLGAESRRIRFDWAGGEARSDDSIAFALQSDTQDPLSLAYQVMRLIRRGVTSVVVLDGQEARAYDLMLLAEETVELPAGQFPAWRVRIGLQSNPQVFTELWLGKEIYGMPIRIRESLADGSFRELVAERISVDAP